MVSGVNVINTNGSGISGANVGTLALSDFDVTATGGTALSLTGSGTVTATGADNDLNAPNNTALNVNAVTIGAAGLTFKSISAGAGANLGVSLVNTGAGGLTVTGSDGPDAGTDPDLGSGGTINGKTGADGSTTAGSGLFFSSATNISLNGMIITNHQNYGIRGAQVDGFRLTFSLVGGVNGTNVASPFSDGSVSFIGTPGTGYGLRGAVAFLDNEITGGFQRNVSIDNATGTMNLDFQRNNVHHTGASFGDDGFAIEVDTTAVLVATVSNNTFTAHGGDHFNLSLVNSANATLTFMNNDMQGGHAIGLGQGVFILGATYNGTFSYNISNNGSVARSVRRQPPGRSDPRQQRQRHRDFQRHHCQQCDWQPGGRRLGVGSGVRHHHRRQGRGRLTHHVDQQQPGPPVTSIEASCSKPVRAALG